MMKGLLLDRVDMSSDDFAKDMGVELPSFILTNTADSEFRINDLAAVAAEKAGDFPLAKGAVEHGFFHHSFPSKLELSH